MQKVDSAAWSDPSLGCVRHPAQQKREDILGDGILLAHYIGLSAYQDASFSGISMSCYRYCWSSAVRYEPTLGHAKNALLGL